MLLVATSTSTALPRVDDLNAETDALVSDPVPLSRRTNYWRWVTPALSVAILAVVAWQLRALNFADIIKSIPRNPWFWVVFFVYYWFGIVCEFYIFKRLWNIPSEGIIALARKNVSNVLLIDYLGEAYFYAWARKKMKMVTSPFGAVKDVAILSAVVSNVVTLVMVAVAYPYAGELDLGVTGKALAGSVGLIALISILVVAFGKRLLSLSRGNLWFVSGVHLTRVIVSEGLLALCWSLALPHVPLTMWLVLATVKMLLSRLPLISNRDVIFAGVAVFLVGRDIEIQVLMALMATLGLLANVTVGIVLAVGDLVTVDRTAEKKAC